MANKEMTPQEWVDKLDRMHRSAGHKMIRDELTQDMMKAIREDAELYKKFQDIKMECKKSDEYDRTSATMLDVNRGLTNLYGVVLKLFSSYKNGNDSTLDSVCSAINKIEERLGMEKTNWEDQDNVTSNAVDVESIKAGNCGAE